MIEKLCYQLKYGWRHKLKENVDAFLNDESGVGTIEIVLILVVLIALVLIFKNSITKLLGNIFTDINADAESIYGNS